MASKIRSERPVELLCRLVTRGFLAHLALLWSLDEPELLRYLKPASCLMVVDGGHLSAPTPIRLLFPHLPAPM